MSRHIREQENSGGAAWVAVLLAVLAVALVGFVVFGLLMVSAPADAPTSQPSDTRTSRARPERVP